MYFKRPPQVLFDDAQDDNEPNYLRFRLSPVSEIALAARVKTPGEEFTGTQRELLIHTESVHERAPYERLLAGAMAGDRALFTAGGSVEAAWRVVDDVLTDHDPAIPLREGFMGSAGGGPRSPRWPQRLARASTTRRGITTAPPTARRTHNDHGQPHAHRNGGPRPHGRRPDAAAHGRRPRGGRPRRQRRRGGRPGGRGRHSRRTRSPTLSRRSKPRAPCGSWCPRATSRTP